MDLITMTDYLYFDTAQMPRQFSSNIEVFKAYLHQRFVLGKFDVDSRFIYQKVSEQDIIRLPELMAYFTVTFNLQLFKGALKTRSGFDIYYFTNPLIPYVQISMRIIHRYLITLILIINLNCI